MLHSSFNLTRKRTWCYHILFIHPITKEKKKNSYVLLTVNWLQGFHTKLQSKALYIIWTGFSFWWLGCSHVGGWNASEKSITEQMGSCLAAKKLCHMEESWDTFNAGNSSRAWTVRPTFTRPLSSRMWWGKQSLSCGTPNFLQASRKFSTFLRHFAMLSLGCEDRILDLHQAFMKEFVFLM